MRRNKFKIHILHIILQYNIMVVGEGNKGGGGEGRV